MTWPAVGASAVVVAWQETEESEVGSMVPSAAQDDVGRQTSQKLAVRTCPGAFPRRVGVAGLKHNVIVQAGN